MRLAVIPARGGSKRIPRKNIRLFKGRPMIAWSIAAAKESGCFDDIVVSTDDAEVAEVARREGASVPFFRPARLADDYAGTLPVMRHAVEWFIEKGQRPDLVCCIYATAPFVVPGDLRRGLEALQENVADYAFSVTSFASPIQRALLVNGKGRIQMVDASQFDFRSQDLQEALHDAGQFYWGTADAWLAEKVIFSSSAVPVRLPRYRVQDIDTVEDWVRAEWLFTQMIEFGEPT